MREEQMHWQGGLCGCARGCLESRCCAMASVSLKYLACCCSCRGTIARHRKSVLPKSSACCYYCNEGEGTLHKSYFLERPRRSEVGFADDSQLEFWKWTVRWVASTCVCVWSLISNTVTAWEEFMMLTVEQNRSCGKRGAINTGK